MKKFRITTLLMVMLFTSGIIALTNTARADDLAKASQNPVSSLISVPFELNFNFNAGPKDETDLVMNVKPVIPISFNKNWNLVNRVIVSLISQGERGPGLGRVFGVGDTTYQGFFSPAKPGKIIWGVGPQLGIPTGMDRATLNQWTLGPTAVVLTMPGKWVIGALASNFWNIGSGYNDAPNVNIFSGQIIVNYNMEGGWFLTSAPVITANWNAESGNQWTVPLGGGLGRIFKIGKQPVSMQVQGFYNVESPDDASDWAMQATLKLLFPKKK